MPSRRETGQDVTLMALDVVGEAGQQQSFIAHTGLAKSATTQSRGDAEVYHMGPPLEVDGRMRADAVGTAGLSDDEDRRIRDFISRHEGEHAAVKLTRTNLLKVLPQVYCIHPHAEPFYEADGRYARMKFSCAGFVFEAYREARILLFDVGILPSIDLATIKEAYPRATCLLDDSDFRGSMGLNSANESSANEWPVMLCGYLLHAMNQENTVIRQGLYRPKKGDQHFAG